MDPQKLFEEKSLRAAEQVRSSMSELAVQLRMTGAGEQFLLELSEELLESAPQSLAAMKDAQNKGDWEGLREAASSLRGPMASLGAGLLVVVLMQVEAHASAEDAEGSALRLAECEAICAQVLQAIRAWADVEARA